MHRNLEYGVGEGVGKEFTMETDSINPPVTTPKDSGSVSHRLDWPVVMIQIAQNHKKGFRPPK